MRRSTTHGEAHCGCAHCSGGGGPWEREGDHERGRGLGTQRGPAGTTRWSWWLRLRQAGGGSGTLGGIRPCTGAPLGDAAEGGGTWGAPLLLPSVSGERLQSEVVVTSSRIENSLVVTSSRVENSKSGLPGCALPDIQKG